MAIIFLFPTSMEAEAFRLAAPDAEVAICGVGMAAAAGSIAEILASRSDLDLVLLAGVAGSYDLSKVALCEVVEVSVEQIEELPDRFGKRYEIDARFALRRVRSNSVNQSNYAAKDSDIEQMEGAAVAAICERLSIPFAEVRAISNYVGDRFEKWCIKGALDALTASLLEIYNRK